MIQLHDVSKSLGGRAVLDGLSFQVEKGSTFVLMGPSGAGKSVTLKHIIGLMRPDSGQVLVDGIEVASLDNRGLRSLRRRMGYLFQSGALINWLDVHDNIALPLQETTNLSPEEIEEKVGLVLEVVRLGDAARKLPDEISGGMRKRVGLARALVTDPEIILYDEPNAGLDPEMSASVNHAIRRLQRELGVTSVVVTHKIGCASTVGDTVAIFDGGSILLQGTMDEILTSEHPRVREFLGDRMD